MPAGSLGHAFQDGFEVVELGDLVPHLPGDHRCHELHEPGRFEVECEADAGGLVCVLAQFEGSGRAGWAGGDLEFQQPWPVERGDLVVAVDAPAAGTGEDLPVSGSLAVATGGAFDFQDPGAPFGVMGAVGEVVEDLVLRSADGDGVLGLWHRWLSLSSAWVSWREAGRRRHVTCVSIR